MPLVLFWLDLIYVYLLDYKLDASKNVVFCPISYFTILLLREKKPYILTKTWGLFSFIFFW